MRKFYIKNLIPLFVLILVLAISVGYSILQSQLTINGTSSISKATWDVHFENVQVKTGSVSGNTVINDDKNTVTFTTTLNLPGEYYEFNVDCKNGGSIDAMINDISKTILTDEQKNYFNYTVTYSNDLQVNSFDLLSSGDLVTYKVRLEFKKDVIAANLPNSEKNITLSFTANYYQADERAVNRSISTLSISAFDEIINKIKTNAVTASDIGTSFDVNVNGMGSFPVKLISIDTPNNCQNTSFSESTCGYVFMFSDPVVSMEMNYNSSNIGGWNSSDLRTYLNDNLFNKLPNELKQNIINTRVVSDSGYNGNSVSVSNDKIYLLSMNEINNTNSYGNLDIALNNTRKLNYTINKENVWLRNSTRDFSGPFFYLDNTKSVSYTASNTLLGVLPVFRIG